jgi:cell fate regulator YaaT (PSP1 superfamily)
MSDKPGGPTPVRDTGPIPVRDNGPIPVRDNGPTPVREAGPAPPKIDSPRPVASAELQILLIRFKGLREECFCFRSTLPGREGEFMIVEADRGQDLGWVKKAADAASATCGGGCDEVGDRAVIPPTKQVIRRASPADVQRSRQLRDEEDQIRRKTRDLVKTHKLKMKVSEAEWQWDRNKLTVYFTADKRVDFRSLVRDMARTFRTRIELRQIGVRDEARRLGGLGRCGRELCCRLWLPDIQPVTLQLAKDQGLSLNPAQISGACGRLMNCLRYEHEMYVQGRKRFPRVGQTLETARGPEEVTGWNLLKETVSLRDQTGQLRNVPLEELKQEAKALRGRR